MTDHNIGDARKLIAVFRNAIGFVPTDVALSTNKITVTAHGFSDADPVRLKSTGNLPAPLEPATDYYVLNKMANDLEVAATPGGTAIDITSVGTGAHTVGTLTDPTVVTFTITEPDGTETAYINGTDAQNVKDSTGRYHVDWTITQAGRHFWKFAGTGALVQAEEDSFVALRSNT